MYDGISSISALQENKLEQTNDQILKLQNHIEWMIESRINTVVGNATEMIVSVASLPIPFIAHVSTGRNDS